MATPKISVVVPIYNVEEYLAWCLDSLLAQDMPDWEGVLVNDGSPDGSRDIAAAYCEKDARFTLVDKPNGGLSSARNAGIAASTAPIVAFLDSDDRLTPDACRVIVDAFEREGCDVLTFGANPYPLEAGYPWLNYVLSPRDVSFEGYSSDLLFKEASRPFAWRTACKCEFLLVTGSCSMKPLSMARTRSSILPRTVVRVRPRLSRTSCMTTAWRARVRSWTPCATTTRHVCWST